MGDKGVQISLETLSKQEELDLIMKFMRLIIDGRQDAYFNMAMDEAISICVREGHTPPTLRFYQWSRPSVSIGYFQKIADIDMDYCKERGYPVVRRLTGGRALLHNHELTYSISAPYGTPFKKDLFENYLIISRVLIEGLRKCGIDASIHENKEKNEYLKSPSCLSISTFGEIRCGDKKIIGSAQKRFSDGFMQHGSIIISYDPQEVSRIFKTGDEEHNNVPFSLCEDLTIGDLIISIKEAFQEMLDIRLIRDEPSSIERKTAERLVKERYSLSDWNFRR